MGIIYKAADKRKITMVCDDFLSFPVSGVYKQCSYETPAVKAPKKNKEDALGKKSLQYLKRCDHFAWNKIYRSPIMNKRTQKENIIENVQNTCCSGSIATLELESRNVTTSLNISSSSPRTNTRLLSKLAPKLLCPCCCGGEDMVDTKDSYKGVEIRSQFYNFAAPAVDASELVKIKQSGRVHHIGVSNMNLEQINRLSAVYTPECLQVEINVTCQQRELVDAVTRLGIPIVAYSPIGSKALADDLRAKTGRDYPNLLELPAVKRIAREHSKSTAQVLLRHLLQLGVGAIPKSTNPIRIRENISVWDFELSEAEMKELNALDRGDDGRICDFTFFPGVEKHPEFPFKRR